MVANDVLAPQGPTEVSSSVTTSTTTPTAPPPQSSSSIVQESIVDENRELGSNKSTKNEIDKVVQECITSTKKLSWGVCEVRCFFAVWMFLTRLPGPTLFVDRNPGYLIKGLVYFPIVGTFIGYWIATFYCFAHVTLTIPPLIASAIALESSFWISGGFEDRLGDTTNRFGSGWSRSHILKMMTDKRSGAYWYIVIYSLIKVFLYTLLVLFIPYRHEDEASSIITNGIIVSQSLSRLVAVYMIKTNRYIDTSNGPKTSFYHFMIAAKQLVSYQRLFFAIVYCFGIVALCYQSYIFAMTLVSIVLICGHYAGRYSTYTSGGITNDFVAATICVVELILLYCILNGEEVIDIVKNTTPVIIYQLETLVHIIRQEKIWDIKYKLLLQQVWKNKQFQSFIQFVVMIVLYKIWCDYVGNPNVRDITNQNTENNNNSSEINISQNTTERDSTNTQTKSGDEKTANTKEESMVVEQEANKSVLEESKKGL